MSTTQRVKKIILQLLNDGKVHEVKEIKSYIASQTSESITEGVIAGSLKTMTTGKVIENVERGMYRLKKEENAELLEPNKVIELTEESKGKVGKRVYDQIHSLTDIYRSNALKIINEIEITEENKEVIFRAMILRKKIDEFCEELSKFEM